MSSRATLPPADETLPGEAWEEGEEGGELDATDEEEEAAAEKAYAAGVAEASVGGTSGAEASRTAESASAGEIAEASGSRASRPAGAWQAPPSTAATAAAMAEAEVAEAARAVTAADEAAVAAAVAATGENAETPADPAPQMTRRPSLLRRLSHGAEAGLRRLSASMGVAAPPPTSPREPRASVMTGPGGVVLQMSSSDSSLQPRHSLSAGSASFALIVCSHRLLSPLPTASRARCHLSCRACGNPLATFTAASLPPCYHRAAITAATPNPSVTPIPP